MPTSEDNVRAYFGDLTSNKLRAIACLNPTNADLEAAANWYGSDTAAESQWSPAAFPVLFLIAMAGGVAVDSVPLLLAGQFGWWAFDVSGKASPLTVSATAILKLLGREHSSIAAAPVHRIAAVPGSGTVVTEPIQIDGSAEKTASDVGILAATAAQATEATSRHN
jgi:hypothetical protein